MLAVESASGFEDSGKSQCWYQRLLADSCQLSSRRLVEVDRLMDCKGRSTCGLFHPGRLSL